MEFLVSFHCLGMSYSNSLIGYLLFPLASLDCLEFGDLFDGYHCFVYKNSNFRKLDAYQYSNPMIELINQYIKDRDAESIIKSIRADPTVLDLSDTQGASVFMLIVYSGMPSVVEEATALKKHFDFFEAIVAGKRELVKAQILQDPERINSFSNDGFSALALAAFFDQRAVAFYLFDKGADPSIPANNPMKVNALHAAVARQNYDLCRLFLLKGMDVNAPQMRQVTALHAAAKLGDMPLVKLLVEYGADTQLKMEGGVTAGELAKKAGHVEVVRYFLDLP